MVAATFLPSRISGMTEVPPLCEHHRDAALLGRGDDLVVLHRSAGLGHRGHTRVGAGIGTVAEWEQRVAGRRPALGPSRRLGRGPQGGTDPALVAGADAHRLTVLDEHDGV